MIQANVPPQDICWLFGDSIYRGMLQMITSYYRAIPPNMLTVAQVRCNKAFRSTRIPIERNYGATSCIFCCCDAAKSLQLGKRHPYALEQLGVCHLMINCYVCLNGDQAGSVNTFDYAPPPLEEYLTL